MWLSIFVKTILPYSVVISMFVTPAWPLPAQVIFGWYSIAFFLGKFLVKPLNNPWFECVFFIVPDRPRLICKPFRYNFFMSPLMLATLSKFGETIGRIVFCQVAFRGAFAHIERINNATSAFVRNECSGYAGGMSHYQLGFLIFEVVFLFIMGLQLLFAMLSSRKIVSEPLMRYNDRMCRQAPGGEA